MSKETVKQKANLIIHPVRLQIVSELYRSPLTPRQLGQLLPTIPQSTLYRHISLLLEGRILEVVAENQVNGVTERTYGLVNNQVSIRPEELKVLSAKEHLEYFTVFATSLIDSFAEYIQGCNLEQIGENGMSYNRVVVYLSDAERAAFREKLAAALGPVMNYSPAPERKRYTLASVVIPTSEKVENIENITEPDKNTLEVKEVKKDDN